MPSESPSEQPFNPDAAGAADRALADRSDQLFIQELGPALEQGESIDQLLGRVWNRLFLERLAPIDPAVQRAYDRIGRRRFSRTDPELYDRIMCAMDQYDHAHTRGEAITSMGSVLDHVRMDCIRHLQKTEAPGSDRLVAFGQLRPSTAIRMRAFTALHQLAVPPLPAVQPGTRGQWRGIPVVVRSITDTGSLLLEPARDSTSDVELKPGLTVSDDAAKLLDLFKQDVGPRAILADFVSDMRG